MQPVIRLALILLFSFAVFPAPALSAADKLKFLSEAHFEFSIELFRQVARAKPGNLVISAQNVNVGLALLFLGSTANTTSSYQLRRTLHYENMSYVDIHRSHKRAQEVLAEKYYTTNHQFYSKTGLFVQKGAGVKEDYGRAVREFYKSEITPVDFGASGSGQVVDTVNQWAAKVTGEAVEQLLSAGPGSDSRLLLASAASIVPGWLHPFDPLATRYNGLFFLPGGRR